MPWGDGAKNCCAFGGEGVLKGAGAKNCCGSEETIPLCMFEKCGSERDCWLKAGGENKKIGGLDCGECMPVGVKERRSVMAGSEAFWLGIGGSGTP